MDRTLTIHRMGGGHLSIYIGADLFVGRGGVGGIIYAGWPHISKLAMRTYFFLFASRHAAGMPAALQQACQLHCYFADKLPACT